MPATPTPLSASAPTMPATFVPCPCEHATRSSQVTFHSKAPQTPDAAERVPHAQQCLRYCPPHIGVAKVFVKIRARLRLVGRGGASVVHSPALGGCARQSVLTVTVSVRCRGPGHVATGSHGKRLRISCGFIVEAVARLPLKDSSPVPATLDVGFQVLVGAPGAAVNLQAEMRLLLSRVALVSISAPACLQRQPSQTLCTTSQTLPWHACFQPGPLFRAGCVRRPAQRTP